MCINILSQGGTEVGISYWFMTFLEHSTHHVLRTHTSFGCEHVEQNKAKQKPYQITQFFMCINEVVYKYTSNNVMI